MWMGPPIRDLLDTMAAAAPDAGAALLRTRGETLDLLVALFRAPGEPADAGMRDEIGRALDAMLAERSARTARVIAFRPA